MQFPPVSCCILPLRPKCLQDNINELCVWTRAVTMISISRAHQVCRFLVCAKRLQNTYVAGWDVSNWDRLSNTEWKCSAWGESATWNKMKHTVMSIMFASVTNSTCWRHIFCQVRVSHASVNSLVRSLWHPPVWQDEIIQFLGTKRL